MTARQFARLMREELLKLKGIPLTSPKAGAIRFSDREAQWEIDDGNTPAKAALSYHLGYNPDSEHFRHAGKLVRAAMTAFA